MRCADITLCGDAASEIIYGATKLGECTGRFRVVDVSHKQNVMTVEVSRTAKCILTVEKSNDFCHIGFREKAHFFRGLSLLMEHVDQTDYQSHEEVHFDSCGAMFDCARNGVPTIDTLKKYCMRLAMFGMNRLYLYLEDVLQLEKYPYWGYLRGRYTKEEIKELDSYARSFGISLVPCIQTLAHLRTALKQPAFEGLRDIDDILLLENDDTYRLLRALLKTVAECFTSGLVHLGMDEAANLGRGRYLDTHGFQTPADIMQRHLQWLIRTCEEFSLQPMIWSDMYLKFNFQVNDYYSISEQAVPSDSARLSKKVALCYWDYYHDDQGFYTKYLRLHKRLGNPMLFAGGAWTWNGISPNISKAVHATREALNACIAENVRDVFCTCWMDNGAETPLSTCGPTLAWYGEYGFGETPDESRVKQRFAFCFETCYERYMLLDAFDNLGYGRGYNRACENPSKTILYEDNLMALHAKSFDELSLKPHYEKLKNEIGNVKNKSRLTAEDKRLFGYYETLARLLHQKAGLYEKTKADYQSEDHAAVRQDAETLIDICSLAKQLRREREDVWMSEYKPFGFEVLDIRLAGVAQRAETAGERLISWAQGKLSNIPELEETILPVRTEEQLASAMQHGYYVWDQIVTATNLDGI